MAKNIEEILGAAASDDALEPPRKLEPPDDPEPPEGPEPLDEPDEAPWPSEVFGGFLEYLDFCKKEYESNIQEVWRHDRALQDDVHDFEFADSDEQAAELGIAFARKRKQRRVHKDAAQLFEEGARFCGDKANKQFFEKMQKLLREQTKREAFLSGERERHYHRRSD